MPKGTELQDAVAAALSEFDEQVEHQDVQQDEPGKDDTSGDSKKDDNNLGGSDTNHKDENGGLFEKDGEDFIFKPSGTTTIYKGKTEKELLSNIANGIVEKDKTIDKYKSGRQRDDRRQPEQEKTAEKPNADKLYNEELLRELQERGLDAKFLEFTANDWAEYKESVGEYEAFETKKQLREADRAAQTKSRETYRGVVRENANHRLIIEETHNVVDFIKEFGLSFSQDEYEVLLGKVLENESSYTVEGILKPGAIQLAVARQLKSQLTKKEQSKLADKLSDDAEKAKKLKEGVKSDQKSNASPNNASDKEPRNIRQGLRKALDEYKVTLRK